MKKTMLSTALLTILCTTGYAESTAPSVPSVPTEAPPVKTTPAASSTNPSTGSAPTAMPSTSSSSTLAAPPSAPVIDCKFHIIATNTNIDQATIETWAKNAAVQSFNFNPTTIDDELTQLKACYTDQGWQGFNDALQKSGNINAIKSQHLTVSSQVDGVLQTNPAKDNQWKVTVPLQVVYQNEKEKLTQSLNVDLLIGRKVTGDLGIMQMIAAPRESSTTPSPAAGQISNPTTATPVTGAPTTSPAATTSTPTASPTTTMPVGAESKPGTPTTSH